MKDLCGTLLEDSQGLDEGPSISEAARLQATPNSHAPRITQKVLRNRNSGNHGEEIEDEDEGEDGKSTKAATSKLVAAAMPVAFWCKHFQTAQSSTNLTGHVCKLTKTPTILSKITE